MRFGLIELPNPPRPFENESPLVKWLYGGHYYNNCGRAAFEALIPMRFIDSFPPDRRRREMQVNVTPTPKTHPRVWAIAFKDYVELRTGKEMPKAEESEIGKEIETKEPDFDTYYANRYAWERDYMAGRSTREQCPSHVPYKLKMKKFKIKVISHEGGKVLETMKISKFRRLTSLSIRYGQCIEVPWNLGRIFFKNSIHYYKLKGGDDAREGEDVPEIPDEANGLVEEIG